MRKRSQKTRSLWSLGPEGSNASWERSALQDDGTKNFLPRPYTYFKASHSFVLPEEGRKKMCVSQGPWLSGRLCWNNFIRQGSKNHQTKQCWDWEVTTKESMKQGKCFTPRFESCDEFTACLKQDILHSPLFVDDSTHNIWSNRSRQDEECKICNRFGCMSKWVDFFNNTYYWSEWIKIMK